MEGKRNEERGRALCVGRDSERAIRLCQRDRFDEERRAGRMGIGTGIDPAGVDNAESGYERVFEEPAYRKAGFLEGEQVGDSRGIYRNSEKRTENRRGCRPGACGLNNTVKRWKNRKRITEVSVRRSTYYEVAQRAKIQNDWETYWLYMFMANQANDEYRRLKPSRLPESRTKKIYVPV